MWENIFSNRVVDEWNRMPEKNNSVMVSNFKKAVSRHWEPNGENFTVDVRYPTSKLKHFLSGNQQQNF